LPTNRHIQTRAPALHLLCRRIVFPMILHRRHGGDARVVASKTWLAHERADPGSCRRNPLYGWVDGAISRRPITGLSELPAGGRPEICKWGLAVRTPGDQASTIPQHMALPSFRGAESSIHCRACPSWVLRYHEGWSEMRFRGRFITGRVFRASAGNPPRAVEQVTVRSGYHQIGGLLGGPCDRPHTAQQYPLDRCAFPRQS